MAQSFDLLVLGAGSGGLAAALRAAKHGARVAVLDPGPLGGTCVNVGCVPKKAMWYAAQLAQMQELAREYGFASEPGALDWPHFLRQRQRYVENSQASYRRQLEQGGITWLAEAGSLLDAATVRCASGELLRAPHVLIATGARPRRLDLPGFELGMVSDDMFTLREPPRRLAVVGGGYVAVEFAGMLRALGSEVSLLVRDRLLADFDAELVHELQQSLLADGVVVKSAVDVAELRRCADGLELVDRNGQSLARADAVLWAVGRQQNTESLGLQELGVTLDERGHVRTNAALETSVEGVYALGDVSQQRALTPVAVAAGRRLADRLFGGQSSAAQHEPLIPSVLFAEPPLASVGLSEAAARAEHGDEAVHVYRARFRPMLWALAQRERQALMKVICVGDEQRVIGIHLHGPGVDEILQGFALAMGLGLRKVDLEAAIAIHPTLAEELLLR